MCVWIKTKERLGDKLKHSQAMHKCAVAYMSDTMLLGASLLPAGRNTTITGGRFFMTSVDHALWFHHPVQADDWLLYEMDSPKCGEWSNHNQLITHSFVFRCIFIKMALSQLLRNAMYD